MRARLKSQLGCDSGGDEFEDTNFGAAVEADAGETADAAIDV